MARHDYEKSFSVKHAELGWVSLEHRFGKKWEVHHGGKTTSHSDLSDVAAYLGGSQV